ncbi:MAG TPA: transketolase [Candidatus Methylomirabilis sp.]|nr:transketolase [Candidatus Methylomirabilis sp.]
MRPEALTRVDPVKVLPEKNRRKKEAMLQFLAQKFRIDVFDILHDKGTGHWGGASSAAELLTALYFDGMNVRPEEPRWPDRDRLVLSKGHASAMLYTVLAYRKFFPVEELDTFRQLNSRLQGHPCMNETPGVDMSTGALGHGMSVSLGMALAARVQQKKYWTYVIMGEGCLDEGQTWEGILAAAKFKPERLVAMIDYNGFQLDGPSNEIMPLAPLFEKFHAFGWNVSPREWNGHSIPEILQSFEWVRQQKEWPVALIYKTQKGRGISFTQDTHKFHGAVIDDQSYAKGRPELMRTLAELEVAL